MGVKQVFKGILSKAEDLQEEEMKAAAEVHWDLPSMTLDELCSASTLIFVSKVLIAASVVAFGPALILEYVPTKKVDVADNASAASSAGRTQRLLLAFAGGGLMAEAALHLLPHLFMPHDSGHHDDGNHDGLADACTLIAVGFLAAFAIDRFVGVRKHGAEGEKTIHGAGNSPAVLEQRDTGEIATDGEAEATSGTIADAVDAAANDAAEKALLEASRVAAAGAPAEGAAKEEATSGGYEADAVESTPGGDGAKESAQEDLAPTSSDSDASALSSLADAADGSSSGDRRGEATVSAPKANVEDGGALHSSKADGASSHEPDAAADEGALQAIESEDGSPVAAADGFTQGAQLLADAAAEGDIASERSHSGSSAAEDDSAAAAVLASATIRAQTVAAIAAGAGGIGDAQEQTPPASANSSRTSEATSESVEGGENSDTAETGQAVQYEGEPRMEKAATDNDPSGGAKGRGKQSASTQPDEDSDGAMDSVKFAEGVDVIPLDEAADAAGSVGTTGSVAPPVLKSDSDASASTKESPSPELTLYGNAKTPVSETETNEKVPAESRSATAKIAASPVHGLHHDGGHHDEDDHGDAEAGAYVTLAVDFLHNVIDGIGIGGAYALGGDAMGHTTAVLKLIHELQHEVGDVATLVQCGMSKHHAIHIQHTTAAGVFLGVAISLGASAFPAGVLSTCLALSAGATFHLASGTVLGPVLAIPAQIGGHAQGLLEVGALAAGAAGVVAIGLAEKWAGIGH